MQPGQANGHGPLVTKGGAPTLLGGAPALAPGSRRTVRPVRARTARTARG
ncbi:hypothetical protein GCM10010259_25800 [Streptomyces daghestanicus]|uniref:Uncharacterized protein n=1 Tax=Streptomyces daghestanicus TaxID=66885 RepID=A0ABQ3QAG0_9ACTN|nr:hypothetical protein GCM10010259_25800 [Streptomyces daghestanicus]GHI34288.1 hypothetical protein Sdagh_60180 [Streptomyces daghestanicus]